MSSLARIANVCAGHEPSSLTATRSRVYVVGMLITRARLLALCLALVPACGGSSTGDTIPDSDDSPLVIVNVIATPAPSARVFANTTVLPNGSAYVCPPIKDGSCTFYACTPRPLGSAPPATAGAVTIAGGLQSLAFVPKSNGTYDPQQLTGALFAGGETLTATSAGTPDVAAFSLGTKAPKVATLSAPTIPTNTDWPIDRTQPIELAWTGLSSTETVSVAIGANTNLPLEVECTFPGDAGKGTISAAALGHLPAGGGYFEIASQTRAGKSDAPWFVRFKVGVDAVDASGAILVGGAELQ